uniref:Probable pectate lyase F n=1 Tax=Meloidogyne incognita TaxID=6306 RepID=A0A914M2R9_MELIC
MLKNNLIFLFFSILYSCEADFWPQARNNITLKAPKKVGGKFDCKYDRYIPDPQIFGDGSQRERQKHVFILKNGATLSNCIIGAAPGTQGSADGIICIGGCNINNVWFEDVGEDAITFYGTAGDPVYNVKGGGARHAADKVFQFDGKGTANIEDYYVEDYVRLFRCCGNCKTEYERRVNIRNLTAIDGMPGQFIVGINEGDVAHLHDIKIDTEGVHPCKLFKPKAGGEPKSLGTGINEYCDYEEAEINYIPARSTQKKKQK